MISKYYNYSKLLSYNATYNGVVGGRGLGKTYGAKRKEIRSSLTKENYQFIYLRRYKPELALARKTFFADIEHEFPEWDFRVNGIEAQAARIDTRDDKKRAWKTIGYFIALSTAQGFKSVAFPHVKAIIFDEFIIEKGSIHYIAEEVTAFNNFYSTVDRYKDKTRVYFLANSVTIMNPYFMEWDIEPSEKNEIITRSNGFLVFHFPDAEEFQNEVFQTKFGKFIEQTDYADYAVGNAFKDNNRAMVVVKGMKEKYQYTLECKAGKFSVWLNYASGEYFIQEKLPKVQTIFTLDAEKMSAEKTMVTFNDKMIAYLRTSFRQGRVSFDKPQTRNAFIEIFKR